MQMEPATYHSYTDYSPRSIITLNARPCAAAQQSSAQLESTTMHKRMEAGAAPAYTAKISRTRDFTRPEYLSEAWQDLVGVTQG
jgi:hypothetical protein